MFGNLNNMSVDDFFKYLGYIAFFLFIIYIITCILRVQNNFLLDSFGVNSIKEGFSEEDQEKLKDYSEKIDLALDGIEKENEKNTKKFSKLPSEVKQTLNDMDEVFSEWFMWMKFNNIIHNLRSKKIAAKTKINQIASELLEIRIKTPIIYEKIKKLLNDEKVEKSSKKSSLW